MKIHDHLRQRLSYSRFKTICGKAEINLVETNTLILCGFFLYIFLPSSTQFHLLDFNYYHNSYSFIRHKQKGSQAEPLTSLGISL